jgi:uncharacterized membrane protein
MRGRGVVHVVKVVAIVLVAFVVFGFVTMQLWNWLMPAIFGLRTISFAQAIGLVLLSKILLSGFRPPWAGRRHWRQRMEERWAHMTPEERERFRDGVRGPCGWGREREPVEEQKSV